LLPACIWFPGWWPSSGGAPISSQGSVNFPSLCGSGCKMDFSSPPTPPHQISLFLLGPFSWQLWRGQPAEKGSIISVWQETAVQLWRGQLVCSRLEQWGVATDASCPRDAVSCSLLLMGVFLLPH
jgi:hypothetical protein